MSRVHVSAWSGGWWRDACPELKRGEGGEGGGRSRRKGVQNRLVPQSKLAGSWLHVTGPCFHLCKTKGGGREAFRGNGAFPISCDILKQRLVCGASAV